MSASLVGSEMCIRDSSVTHPWQPWPNQPRGRGKPQGRGRGGSRMDRWQPVSYTHLTLPTICSV
eukprot:1310818-Alexandrium_andersonii.AAC.1